MSLWTRVVSEAAAHTSLLLICTPTSATPTVHSTIHPPLISVCDPDIAWTSDVDYRFSQPDGFKSGAKTSGLSCDKTLNVTGATQTTYKGSKSYLWSSSMS